MIITLDIEMHKIDKKKYNIHSFLDLQLSFVSRVYLNIQTTLFFPRNSCNAMGVPVGY